MIPTLQSIEKTCIACPAQIDDARFEWELGDGLDGLMDWDQASDYFDRAVRAQYARGD